MIETLVSAFLSPLRETFFQKALIGGSMVAAVSGVVGCLVILRRMAFLGDALSHAMIAGVACGYLFMKILFGVEAHAPAMLLGSLIAAVLTVALIGFVGRVSRLKEDTAIGIMYTGVFAAGVLVVSVFRNYIHIDLMHFIMGDVLAVADADLWAAAIAAALVLSVILLFYRHFQLATFDPVMAAAIGMPVLLIQYALTTCVSLVVVSAVSMVGVILVVGLLITPAATAYLLSDRLHRMMALAALFGLTSVIGGLYLCVWLDSAGGGAVMVFATLQFGTVLIVAPRHGLLARWRRRRGMVPQQLVEDILGTVLRAEGQAVPLDAVDTLLPEHHRIGRAVRSLIGSGLLESVDRRVRLTEAGRKEALRIRRAHRLWEAYLQHVGTPRADLHPRAHQLEHRHDPSAVEYIDDLLGHPIRDPHAQEIPTDASRFEAGERLALSMLREGHRAVVASLSRAAVELPLAPGTRIEVGPRQDDGRTWVVRCPDGTLLHLDHAQADAVQVRLARD